MTKAKTALTRALEEAAAPGRRTIIDALTSDTVCPCGQRGAQPRKWAKNGHDVARGFFCDDCEARARRALVYARAGRYTRALQEVRGIAS